MIGPLAPDVLEVCAPNLAPALLLNRRSYGVFIRHARVAIPNWRGISFVTSGRDFAAGALVSSSHATAIDPRVAAKLAEANQ